MRSLERVNLGRKDAPSQTHNATGAMQVVSLIRLPEAAPPLIGYSKIITNLGGHAGGDQPNRYGNRATVRSVVDLRRPHAAAVITSKGMGLVT